MVTVMDVFNCYYFEWGFLNVTLIPKNIYFNFKAFCSFVLFYFSFEMTVYRFEFLTRLWILNMKLHIYIQQDVNHIQHYCSSFHTNYKRIRPKNPYKNVLFCLVPLWLHRKNNRHLRIGIWFVVGDLKTISCSLLIMQHGCVTVTIKYIVGT